MGQPSLQILWLEDPAKDILVFPWTGHVIGVEDSLWSHVKEDSRTMQQNITRSVQEQFYQDTYVEFSEIVAQWECHFVSCR